MNNNDNAAIILTRLIEHLKKHHTLSNMNASLPKADDYHAFLGRGESVLEVIAKACGVNYEVMQEFERQSKETDYFMIHKVYLEALLKESQNERAINVIVAETGIKFARTRLKSAPLNFKSVDSEEMVAKTPFHDYEISKYPNYWRARVNMHGKVEDVGPRRSMDLKEAIKLCNEHYMVKLNQANAELIQSSGCERCDSLHDNPNPCCDMGNCEEKEGESGIANCIHCGGELHEKDGAWYHHSQFDHDELGEPQDYVK